MAERSYPSPKVGAVAERARLRGHRATERSYPTPEVRGGGQEELPHVQGVVAARVQEGREELFHVHGQEGQPVRRYPSSKVRSSSCTLLEQP